MDPIPIRPLHEEVAHRIREMIRKGHLQVGERIVEKRLCETLGVSRTPLREALRVLSTEGLVRLVPNRGAFVSQPTMAEIRDMFEAMAVLEGTCARWACERAPDGGIEHLKALHDELERHFRNRDPERYIQTNHVFHTLLQELSGNRTLDTLLRSLRHRLFLYRYRQLYQPDRFRRSIEEHRRLIRALEARDAGAAEAAMQEHLINQCEALVSLYDGA